MRPYIRDKNIGYGHWSMYLRVAGEITGSAKLSPQLLLRLSELRG